MKAVRVVSVLALVTLGMLVAPAVVMGQLGQGGETAVETAPGERLSGVVGSQDVEHESDLDERVFGIHMANASTDDVRADVIAERVGTLKERLETIEDRKNALEAAHEDGNISTGTYQSRLAKLEAERNALERATNQTNTAAGQLPGDVLAERGINVTAIQHLQERAHNLTGPEVAEIARSIAGDPPGPGDRGPPGGQTDVRELPDNTTDATAVVETELVRAADRLERAERHVDEDDENARAVLEQGKQNLSIANEAFERGVDHAAANETEEALMAFEEAMDAIEVTLERAAMLLPGPPGDPPGLDNGPPGPDDGEAGPP